VGFFNQPFTQSPNYCCAAAGHRSLTTASHYCLDIQNRKFIYFSYNLPQISDKKYKDNLMDGGIDMAEEKGLNKPVKLKADLAAFLGASALPRTEITKKLWDYIKANKLQTKTINGKPENAGKYIVADAKLIKIFNNTKTTSKTGTVTDLTKLKEGQTIDMMQMASVVSANIE
jgi:chromatin remodeling complex protein RSC6